MSLTPKSSDFHFAIEGDPINKILADQKGDFINRRYKAVNDKLLKNQRMYQEKYCNIDDHMVWKY